MTRCKNAQILKTHHCISVDGIKNGLFLYYCISNVTSNVFEKQFPVPTSEDFADILFLNLVLIHYTRSLAFFKTCILKVVEKGFQGQRSEE